MKHTLIDEAAKIVKNHNLLTNLVSKRVKQLKNGSKPLVESLEKLTLEDTALKEIIAGKLDYELFDEDK